MIHWRKEKTENKEKIEEQYTKLALPKHWIKIIEDNEKEIEKEKSKVFLKAGDDKIVFNDCVIKMFYTCLRKTVFVKSKAIEYCEKLFDNFDALNIWKNIRLNFKSPVFENFDFLLRQLYDDRNDFK